MSYVLVDAAFKVPLPPNLKVTLLALARESDDDGNAIYRGHGILMEDTGYSDRGIAQNIRRLITLDLATFVEGGRYRGDAKVYELNAEKIYNLALDHGWVDRRKGDESSAFPSARPKSARDKGEVSASKGRRNVGPPSIPSIPSGTADFIDEGDVVSVADEDTPPLVEVQEGETWTEALTRHLRRTG